jgi:hypothetical protein
VLHRRKALEALDRDSEASAAAEGEALATKAWHAAFAEAVGALPVREGLPPLLWYVRRRAVPYRTNTEGLPIAVGGDDIVISGVVNDNLVRLKLEKRLAAVSAKGTPQANARVMALLGGPAIAASDILTVAVIADLEKVSEPAPAPTPPTRGTPALEAAAPDRIGAIRASDLLAARTGLSRLNLATARGETAVARADTELGLSESEVLDIATDYSSSRLGEGLAAAAAVLGSDWPTAKQATAVGDSGVALEIDTGLRGAKPELVAEIAEKLKAAATKNDTEALAKIAQALA